MKNTTPFERGDWVVLVLNATPTMFVGQIVGTSEIRGIRATVHGALRGKEFELEPCALEDFVFPWTSVAFMRLMPDPPNWCKCGEAS
jgi:hypothetical protein